MLRFSYFFLLEKSFFSGGTILKGVSIGQVKVSVCLHICLGCKSCENLSIVAKIDLFSMEVILVCTPKNVDAC